MLERHQKLFNRVFGVTIWISESMLVVSACVVITLTPTLIWIAVINIPIVVTFVIAGTLMSSASDANEGKLKDALCSKCKQIYQYYVDECE
jgi:hypothetical protein